MSTPHDVQLMANEEDARAKIYATIDPPPAAKSTCSKGMLLLLLLLSLTLLSFNYSSSTCTHHQHSSLPPTLYSSSLFLSLSLSPSLSQKVIALALNLPLLVGIFALPFVEDLVRKNATWGYKITTFGSLPQLYGLVVICCLILPNFVKLWVGFAITSKGRKKYGYKNPVHCEFIASPKTERTLYSSTFIFFSPFFSFRIAEMISTQKTAHKHPPTHTSETQRTHTHFSDHSDHSTLHSHFHILFSFFCSSLI